MYEVIQGNSRQVFPTARKAISAARVGINERRAAVARVEQGYELTFFNPVQRTVRMVEAAPVQKPALGIERLVIDYVGEERDFAEISVFFSSDDWQSLSGVALTALVESGFAKRGIDSSCLFRLEDGEERDCARFEVGSRFLCCVDRPEPQQVFP